MHPDAQRILENLEDNREWFASQLPPDSPSSGNGGAGGNGGDNEQRNGQSIEDLDGPMTDAEDHAPVPNDSDGNEPPPGQMAGDFYQDAAEFQGASGGGSCPVASSSEQMENEDNDSSGRIRPTYRVVNDADSNDADEEAEEDEDDKTLMTPPRQRVNRLNSAVVHGTPSSPGSLHPEIGNTERRNSDIMSIVQQVAFVQQQHRATSGEPTSMAEAHRGEMKLQ